MGEPDFSLGTRVAGQEIVQAAQNPDNVPGDFIHPSLNQGHRLRKSEVSRREIPLEPPRFSHSFHPIFLHREGKHEIVKLANAFRFDSSESDRAMCYPVSQRHR